MAEPINAYPFSISINQGDDGSIESTLFKNGVPVGYAVGSADSLPQLLTPQNVMLWRARQP